MKNTEQQIKELEALIHIYKDQEDELVNKVWAWGKQREAEVREETLKEIIELVDAGFDIESIRKMRNSLNQNK